MKHFIAFFLSLSVFCFIAFGISVAVLGIEPTTNKALMKEYTELGGSYNDIEITTSVANIAVYPTEGKTTKIFTTERLANSVSAEIKDNKLVVKLDHSQYIFTDFFGFISSLLSGGNNDCVKVYVPDDIYENINIKSNAGSTEMIGVAAQDVALDLSAGNLTYAQPDGVTAETLLVHLSAGNCTVYNAKSDKFDIEMSAGNIDVYGLSGKGEIDISAGNGNINLSELNGDITINASAGNLDLNLPEGANATIECDKSAGGVSVKYGDIENDLNDNEKVTIGTGRYKIFADVSAGGINITDKVKEMQAPSIPDMPEMPESAATTAIAVSSVPVSNNILPTETESPTWNRTPTSSNIHDPENDSFPMNVREGSGLVEYSFAPDSNQDINITTSNIDVAIYPNEDDLVKIYTSRNVSEKIYIKRQNEYTLNIQLDENDSNLNSANGVKERIEIYLPQPTYDPMSSPSPTYNLDTNVNYGNLEILDINLDFTNVKVANGDLILAQPDIQGVLGCREFDISVEKGDCSIYNALVWGSDGYDISVNSGELNVYGISGSALKGNFNLTDCHQCNINFTNLGKEVKITSNQSNVKINAPKGKNATTVRCTKTEGNVTVDCEGVEATMNNGEVVVIDAGTEHDIYLDVSGGNISITDDVVYKNAPTPPNPPIFEAA